MFTSTTKRLGITSVIIGGLAGIFLTFGTAVIGQDVPIWQKIQNRVEISPRNTALVVDAFTQGGTAVATSTSGTTFGALSQAQMLVSSVITMTPNVTSATTTLAATSTMTSLIPAVGDTRTWTLLNGTSTSAITAGIAAGTGINLTSNTLNNVQIPPDGSARLTCVRLANTDVHCQVAILSEGD